MNCKGIFHSLPVIHNIAIKTMYECFNHKIKVKKILLYLFVYDHCYASNCSSFNIKTEKKND